MPLAVSHTKTVQASDLTDRLLHSLEPLTQIVMGVGMVLAGVLNLVGNLLSGLGLDSLLKGIMGATVSLSE